MKKVNLEMAIESFYVPLYVKAYDSKHALKCQDRNVAVVNEPIDIPLEALDRATVCKLSLPDSDDSRARESKPGCCGIRGEAVLAGVFCFR